MTRIHSLQIIGSKSFGGAERWFQRFSTSLAELGHRTELAVRKGYALDRDIWQGLAYHALPMRTVWDPLSRHEVAKLIRRLQPDLVQTYMGRATRLTVAAEGKGPVHLARLGGYYKLAGYRHADAWIGNTKGIRDYLLDNGFPRDRVFHIYNFFEPPSVDGETVQRAVWNVPEDALVLMTPGRLIPVKGQRYLLEAMRCLPRELGGRPLWLMVLGDGPLAGSLKDLARQLGIAERVVWTGWQSDPGPFYRLADVIVFPSLERETFGNVILEAWGFAKPLATTAFRGAQEIVHHAEDALMTPCAEPQALADSIRKLCVDADLSQSLVRAGHRRLLEDFSKSAIMRQYVDLYSQLIGRA
ncbi:MAG: glycosyltransferase [Gammaproteobacteria bacterium]|nr:glycosyltransferase [Gammaproteobacteria bacterium]